MKRVVEVKGGSVSIKASIVSNGKLTSDEMEQVRSDLAHDLMRVIERLKYGSVFR